ncbi:MAG: DUF1624 domain-containing protein [Roseitalea sp.]|jgi:uncharacterized membrane protein|nr:DUF1624 domain-containing protein [Roseitalea sp.]MBO6723166.1 DUF1624 domain-containing protein [Roseitalea sp.]MBO6744628.1 DUF1624 domain-containing protein [Roseitalea sp.]
MTGISGAEVVPRGRIDALDVARGVALIAMATYHFSWDLEFFGYLEPGTSTTGPLKYYARSIAASFLFLVGIGIVLAHANGIRWRSFAKRWVKIAAAAALITIATWFATRETFVFFGILHHIAFASLAGLLFLGLPWWVLAVIAIAVFFGTPFLQSPIYTPLGFAWTGLSATPPRSNDFVPVLPWFSAVLAGMAAAKLVFVGRTPPRVLTPEGWSATGVPSRLIALFGRWSLTFYLVHQPILIGLVFLASLVFPAQPPGFSASCTDACGAQFGAEPCAVYCACAEAELAAAGKLDDLLTEPATAQSDLETSAIIAQCAFEAGTTGDGNNR